nr:odorant binding protein 30 [Pagiophloeus tsushimanus]
MKSFAFALCFVVAVVLANPVQERWNRVHQECQQSTTTFVPDIIFEQLKRGEHPNLPANFGLHANCMLKKLDLQDGQGHVLSDGVKEAVQRHYTDAGKVNQIITECSVNKESPEKTALNLFGCLGKNKVNIGQL